MKRMLWALAVIGLAGTGTSRADWGGYGPPVPQPGNPVQPVRNEFSAPNTLMGLGHHHSGKAPDRYGLLPGLRKAFRLNDGCDTCGKPGLFSKGGSAFGGHPGGGGFGGHPGHGGGGFGGNPGGGGGFGGAGMDYPQYPPVNQGTLVFPNHQFVRSPRDFFMYEPGR
jgi:hypothetical protein